MADPLSLSDFFDTFRATVDSRFYLPGVRQHSRTGSGEVLSSVLGHQLWRGEVTAYVRGRRAVAALQAQIEELDRAGDPFLIHPFPCGNAHDPDGSIIAGHNPEIAAVSSDRIRLRNLPSGYRFQRGDFLSFAYGSNPVRYALHRVMDLTSTGLGSGMRVSPRPRPGVAIGAPVTLYKPVCKAIIEPGSIQWPDYGSVVAGTISFRFIQTLGR
ncbi:hypothetical protein [uncultured Paracoccus sp.]|uniref:hypothetical protein n=1 Tax=uncultured Paracoccus sp. TaxID=189685 RepID=UPI0025D83F3D|nr:hypothetical protein [uncultured Paracoccus sp.]